MTMLGARCSVCCGQCGCKVEERLPYTMTVEFSGLKNKTHGNYCDLVITSEVGGGAAGVATSPGGCDGDTDPLCCEYHQRSDGQCASSPYCDKSNRGPLTGVLLTDGGCGYFVFRTEPTLTVEGGSGTKADFAVTLKKDKCSWSVDAVTVTGIADTVVMCRDLVSGERGVIYRDTASRSNCSRAACRSSSLATASTY